MAGGPIARDFAAHGVKAVSAPYNSNALRDDAEATVKAVPETGAQARAFQADLTMAGPEEKLLTDANGACGKVEIAIKTVGIVLKKPMSEVTEAEFDQMSAVNSKSASLFLEEAGRTVEDHGKIVTLVTSLLGAFTPFCAAYAGGTAPVEHWTRAAAKAFGAHGIPVIAVGPEPMDTPFLYPAECKDAVAFDKMTAALSRHSSKGSTHVKHVVPFFRHLVTEGSWITGQTILINDGFKTK